MRLFEGTQFDIPPRCDRCEKLLEECDCSEVIAPPDFAAPESQTAAVKVEKRKRGKVVTVIEGLTAADNDLHTLVTDLKNLCGSGGTIRGDLIEIQGNHQERITQRLQAMGFRIRR